MPPDLVVVLSVGALLVGMGLCVPCCLLRIARASKNGDSSFPAGEVIVLRAYVRASLILVTSGVLCIILVVARLVGLW